MRHGPHYAARKPASTRPAPLTVESKFSAVSSIVARHWVSGRRLTDRAVCLVLGCHGETAGTN